MSKYDSVLRADYTPLGAVDNKGGGIIDGRMIMIGSVGADKISVKELSDLIQAMGTLRTGTIHLGGSVQSFLRATSDPVPRLELVDPQRRYVVVFDANPLNGVTVAMGIPDANGVHPFRIPASTGDVEIRTRAIVGMNSTARTFIDAGLIDLLATGTTSWDAADATAIRLKAAWGIASKQAGTQSVKWDAETGYIAAGENNDVIFSRYGMSFDIDNGTYTDLIWSTSPLDPYTLWNGRIGTYLYPTSKSVEMNIRTIGNSTYTEAVVQLAATRSALQSGGSIAVVDHDGASGHTWRTPGIFLTPPGGYPVTVQGSLVATGGIAASGTISGDIQVESWPYDYDPPDSEARQGRLLAHLQEGTRYRLWMGRGETNGWAYLDFTENE